MLDTRRMRHGKRKLVIYNLGYIEKLGLLGHQMKLLLKRQWIFEEKTLALDLGSRVVSAAYWYAKSDGQQSFWACFSHR